MKAFALTDEQAARVIAALIVDELSVRFARHIDSMTGAAWNGETPLGADGAALSEQERAACAGRALRFFGIDSAAAVDLAGDLIGDWAGRATQALVTRQTHFRFTAAGDDAREFTHAADATYADAAAAANLLYGRRRAISLVAPHGLMGFALTILAPNLLQIPSIDARALAPEQLTASLTYGDVLIATPTLWRYMMRERVTAPDNAVGVFFGEPMASDLAASMRKAGFSAQREIYGSTEGGLIGWRDATTDPFVLFDHWSRREQAIARVTPVGATVVHTPLDALQWTGERRFLLGGRRDGAVQIGAVNVFPARIAGRIAEHPDVKSCEIKVSKDDGGANRLVASITLAGAAPSEMIARSIDSWCRARLAPHERPRVYHYL